MSETAYGFNLVSSECFGELHQTVQKHPFDEDTSIEDILNFNWISPDDFDYESVKRKCAAHPDKALQFGHEGPFQLATYMMDMETLFAKMILEPDVAHTLYDRLVEFELEYYERILIAGDGQIDILRPHDDYGSQMSTLFSVPMWKEYFELNTKKLVNLARRYGAFYQQHSCGAVGDLIPCFIDCGVDILEPLQKVKGLEIEMLKRKYGGKLTFHGGIDTQHLLPYCSPEEVELETRRYIETLGRNGGYILMASQWFEADVPVANIDAMYQTNRYLT